MENPDIRVGDAELSTPSATAPASRREIGY